jgi:hypothetical protein
MKGAVAARMRTESPRKIGRENGACRMSGVLGGNCRYGESGFPAAAAPASGRIRTSA